MSSKKERYKIKAVDCKNGDYTDSAYTGLYNTAVSMGINETTLIWLRYSGFLILQGLIVNSLKTSFAPINYYIIIPLCVIGYLVSAIWCILNYCGWLYQNLWYTYASRFDFTNLKIDLITKQWEKEKKRKPDGIIYYLAQAIPILFMILYIVLLFISLNTTEFSNTLIIIGLIIFCVIPWICILKIANHEYEIAIKR